MNAVSELFVEKLTMLLELEISTEIPVDCKNARTQTISDYWDDPWAGVRN